MLNLFDRFTQSLRQERRSKRRRVDVVATSPVLPTQTAVMRRGHGSSTHEGEDAGAEQLESRMLLTINNLGAIQGQVYEDLAKDGLTVDDAPQTSFSVKLYRDGGDLVFGNGAGDDKFVGTDQTDSKGKFLFTGLTAGRYFVEQPAIPGLVQLPGENVVTININSAEAQGTQGSVIIDAFDTPVGGQSITATGAGAKIHSSLAATVVGGERDVTVEIQSGTNSADLLVNSKSSGVLRFTSAAATAARYSVVWDGVDGSATKFNPTGLGGIDLTNEGRDTAILFTTGADTDGVTGTIRIYSSATDYSEGTFVIPNSGTTPTNDQLIFLRDLELGTGATGTADLTHVGAIEFILDATIHATGTIGIVASRTSFLKVANFANFHELTLGDLVWNDVNSNGVFDVDTESGIDDVSVELYADSDSNGVYTDGVDALMGTQATAGGGHYQFTNLLPGKYLIRIPQSNFDVGGPLEGLPNRSNGNLPTPDPDDDTPDDNNGDSLSPGLGFASAAVSLSGLGEPIDDGDIDNNTNLSVDFGFFDGVDLDVDITDSSDPADAGDLLTYKLSAINVGSTIATGTTLTSTLPSNVTIESISTTHGIAGHVGNMVTADIGRLDAQTTAVVTVVVRVDGDASGILAASASVTSAENELDLSNNSDTHETGVRQVSDLVVTQSDVDPVDAGSSFDYTLTVTNNGPSTATGVVVTDLLPNGVAYVSSSVTQGLVDESNGTVTATVGTLASGESATITISLTVDNSTLGTLNNIVAVVADQLDLDTDNNTHTQATTVRPVVDLSLTQTDDVDPIHAGDLLTYTLTATNSGPSVATNVVVTDNLPVGVTYQSGAASQGSVSHLAGVVTADIGTLAAGETATVTIVVHVAGNADAMINNVASITSSEFDTATANNSETQATEVIPVADLSITQTDSADPINDGNTLTYKFTITNDGPSTATGVKFFDILPSDVTFSAATSDGGTVDLIAGTLVGNLDDIAPGESVTISVDVVVADDANGLLMNTGSVSASTLDLNTGNDSATVETTAQPVVDLSVTTTDDMDSVFVNGTVSYTILVTNNGPSTATNVVLQDTLPAALTYSSATSTQGDVVLNGDGTITGSLGTIARGETVTVTLVATAGVTTGRFDNTVVVSADQLELATASNSDIESTTINPLIDLQLTVSEGSDPVIAGEALTYTIHVTNNGPSTATSVVMTDVLPTGLTYLSSFSSQGAVSETGGIVTANLGNIAAGAFVTITVQAMVPSSATSSIHNSPVVTATEAELNPTNNTETELTTVNQLVDLSIVKTDQPSHVPDDGLVTYILTITNDGPSDATGVTLADVLPNTVSYVSAIASQGSAGHASGTVNASLGTIVSGASATVTIVVDLGASNVMSITDTASVTSGQPESDNSNNTLAQPTAVTPQIDLSVTTTDSSDPIIAGNTLTYVLTVQNNGRSNAIGVVLTDVLPTGVTYLSGSASQGLVNQSNGTVTANIDSLASGATANVTITVAVPITIAGSITNATSVASGNTDTNVLDNSDSESTFVNPVTDLVITNAASTDPVIAGNTLTYNLSVSNTGPQAATNVVLSDVLPAGTTFVSATPSQGTATASNGTLTANLGTLAVGETATIALTVRVGGAVTSQLSNSATATSAEVELTPANNSATQATNVISRVDLVITQSHGTAPIYSGSTLTYTITATNNGPSTATGVIVTDTLDAVLSYASGSVTQGTISHANSTVTANLGTLASGASATVTITVLVSEDFDGDLPNSAAVTTNETDLALSNNASTDSVEVGIPIGSLTGRVYVDLNSNGVLNSTDIVLGGVILQVAPIDSNGQATGPVIITTTDSSGVFRFPTLLAGRYRLVEIQPEVFAQGGETIGNHGGTNPFANVIDGITISPSQESSGYQFREGRQALSQRRYIASNGTLPQASSGQQTSLSGRVYSDVDADAVLDPADHVLSQVRIELVPINASGVATGPALIAMTDFNGFYRFSNVVPGRYRLIETQPENFSNRTELLGSAGGTNSDVTDDIIDEVMLSLGLMGTDYDFVEGLPIAT